MTNLREELRVELAAITLIEAGTIPRTTSGKPQRLLVRDDYLAQTLAYVERG